MINSSEFIYSLGSDLTGNSDLQGKNIKGDFIEFNDSSLRFKIDYPVVWIIKRELNGKNVVYFQSLLPMI